MQRIKEVSNTPLKHLSNKFTIQQFLFDSEKIAIHTSVLPSLKIQLTLTGCKGAIETKDNFGDSSTSYWVKSGHQSLILVPTGDQAESLSRISVPLITAQGTSTLSEETTKFNFSLLIGRISVPLSLDFIDRLLAAQHILTQDIEDLLDLYDSQEHGGTLHETKTASVEYLVHVLVPESEIEILNSDVLLSCRLKKLNVGFCSKTQVSMQSNFQNIDMVTKFYLLYD